MHFQCTFPFESAVTMFACEWLLFAVFLHVLFHFTLAAELFAALCACEWEPIAVCPQVLQHQVQIVRALLLVLLLFDHCIIIS